MFSFNAAHKLPALQQTERFWKNTSRGQSIIKFFSSLDEATPSESKHNRVKEQSDISPDHNCRDRFMDIGNDHLLDIVLWDQTSKNKDSGEPQEEGHQSSIKYTPMDFIRYFCLEKVFRSQIEEIDFGSALAALDYIQDLEWTRQEVIRKAIIKLGITERNWQEVLSGVPIALEWVKDTQRWNTGLEICFAELYVGLRIWIMAHELKGTHVVENDALAMLNTLFPPCAKRLPNRVPRKVFHLLRATFFEYLVSAKSNGPEPLDRYIENLERPGNKYSWKMVRECVTDYIYLVDDLARKAQEIHSIESFRDEDADSILHSPFQGDCSKMDAANLSQRSDSPTLSNLSRTSSTESSSAEDRHPTMYTPETPIARTDLRDSPQDFATIPTDVPPTPKLETEHYKGSLSNVKRRIFQERNKSFTGRPITSDDVIFPGTPLLPDTLGEVDDSDLDTPMSSTALHISNMNSPYLNQHGRSHRALETSFASCGRPELKPMASFTQLLRKKMSLGSSSTSRTLRESFMNQEGLGISLGLSKSAESLPNDDTNTELSERTIQNEIKNVHSLKGLVSIYSSTRSRSGTLHTLESKASPRRFASIEQSLLPSSPITHQVKRKRSLPAIFSWKKSSPSKRDSEPPCLKADGNFEKYALLSELQPVKSLPIMGGHKLQKVKSCFTVKSVADFQATINSNTASYGTTEGKKLTKIKSVATLKKAADSPVIMPPALQRKRLQKAPKSELNILKRSSPQTHVPPVPEPWFIKPRQPIKFTWVPNSDDWKSREYTRHYYLEKYRAQRFDLRDPEGGPYKLTSKTVDGIVHRDRPRAAPKDLIRPSTQRPDSIFQTRESPKKPTSKSYTMIDIDKYAR